ncbi:hypothetical protein [Spirosoma fluviale]|nr:hypothetical protein [Spirosoma fluviale]
MQCNYDETDFVLYALAEMKIPVLNHTGKHITLENGYQIEVEKRDLYRLSVDGFVISPFDDMGELCQFIQRNGSPEDDD